MQPAIYNLITELRAQANRLEALAADLVLPKENVDIPGLLAQLSMRDGLYTISPKISWHVRDGKVSSQKIEWTVYDGQMHHKAPTLAAAGTLALARFQPPPPADTIANVQQQIAETVNPMPF